MIIEINSDNMLKMMHDAIINQKYRTFWGIHHNGIILVPNAGVVDEQLCHDMGYKVYETFDPAGGSIVANAGDINVCNFGYRHNNFLQEFGNNFTKWLQSKGLNAEFIKNDILIDDYKICGTCITNYNDIDYTAIHIGINTNLEDIKKICRKPMKKIPKGLSEFGITTEEVKNWIIDFTEKYELSLPSFLR